MDPVQRSDADHRLRPLTANDQRTCAECGGSADAHGTYFCVQFENQSHEVWKDFCSWEHIIAWVRKGEPDWDAEATASDPMTWWGRLGCVATVLLLLAIFTLGLISLVGLIL